ncbi:recombinase family protein [Mycobacterium sp. 852002-51163_SCH5372311]|uniref:recombinase family protein n=1 Tax=Mycobacterium sp. 852002-51163_SCH5372311 TaxID=1834097 RepID=UPI000AB0A8E0|nr:recombinase family protein [Mycobacterium sp. 852002-51163_SCH5372311]
MVRRIVRDRNAGWTYDAIASALTEEKTLSPLGKPAWQPSTVRRIYASATTQVQVSA